jgi:hypothetical protein
VPTGQLSCCPVAHIRGDSVDASPRLGFLETLFDHPDRFRLATNTGNVPYAFGNLAALIGLALVADGERLVGGTWWD